MYTSISEKKIKIIWFIILFWVFQQQWQQQKERFKTARQLGIWTKTSEEKVIQART